VALSRDISTMLEPVNNGVTIRSSIGEEKDLKSRQTKPLNELVEIMSSLSLVGMPENDRRGGTVEEFKCCGREIKSIIEADMLLFM
jgi:hypothetical protein